MKKLQKGFTIIELVIVIVIIGLLAAIALPKYVAMQQDARLAKMQAFYGAIRSAALLAKARCEIDLANGYTAVGQCGNAAPSVTMDGSVVTMINRYPTANAAGIVTAAGINPAAISVATAVDGVYATGGGAVAGSIITINAVGGAGVCTVTYTAPAVGAAPVIAMPATQAGC